MASILIDKAQQRVGGAQPVSAGLLVGADNLREALAGSQSEPCVVMVLADAEGASGAIDEVRKFARASSVVIAAASSGIESVPANRLLQTIAAGDQAPAILAFPSTLIAALSIDEGDTLASMAGKALTRAIGQGITIQSLTLPSAKPSNAIRAQILRGILAAAAIEDLFPHHAWNSHKEESLAASLHTVAAMFIRLGDLEAAEDCLQQSEPLEDSPRALALKGIISARHGETLGAVANMVSSLQQYEQRKRNQNGHYLEFSPLSIEKVTYNLKEGLSALNKRNNDEALAKFQTAVFSFDSFYSDMGIDEESR